MNIESRTDRAKGLRTHVIRGPVNPPEIKNFLGALFLSGGFDPNIHALWDLREADFSSVSQADIKEMACFARVNWAEKHRRKIALVISGDFRFGLSRMFEQFIGPPADGKIRTFRDLQLAFDWIEGKGTAAPHPPGG
jgi:hypothetical protein